MLSSPRLFDPLSAGEGEFGVVYKANWNGEGQKGATVGQAASSAFVRAPLVAPREGAFATTPCTLGPCTQTSCCLAAEGPARPS